jgi:uncharacterized membrane protein YhaH (DUF805 family)
MIGMAPTMKWTRLSRRLALDRNPLRRRSDRVEAWLLPAVIAALLILGPAVGLLASRWASDHNSAAWQSQRQWHRVSAVLLQNAPGPLYPDGGQNSWIVWTPARWTVGTVTHIAKVPAVSDSRAGSAITVWLDQTGSVRQPLTAGAARGRDTTAVAVAVGVLALLLSSVAMAARRLLDRHRLSGWEAGWLSVGPQWTGRR